MTKMGTLDFIHEPSTTFADVGDLSEEDARREVEALREGIAYHDDRYYVKNEPEISDTVYDKLFARLEELEEAFPELATDNSPTRRVGAEPVGQLQRVEHAAPMLSLNAVFEAERVQSFLETVAKASDREKPKFVCEPKFDGVSIEVVYERGDYIRGTSRGDGRTGENVTANLRTVRALPLRLGGDQQPPERLAVRGEVLLPKQAFQDLNRERIERGKEPLANPRNAAAGTIRLLDPSQVAKRPLDIFFYDVLAVEGKSFDTHWNVLAQFEQWGLKTDAHNRRCVSVDDIRQFHGSLAEQREDLPYEIDGIVLKADDLGLREKLGTRDRNPRWALAWKFEPREEVTRLRQIVVQVGMTGILTPVALLDPVDVGGVTVSRATLHNESETRRKDVRPGDTVRVVRAGDVIPEVVERIKQPGRKRADKFSMPEKCPACNTRIVRQGAYHLCPSSDSCPPQLIGRLRHFAAQDAVDIDGLGDETVRELVERGLVHDLADLYDLSADQLCELETFGETKAGKLHRNIQDSKRPPLDRFLVGMGIRHVGRRVAGLLAREFGSLEELTKADRQRLERLPEIGPEIAQSVVRFFDNPRTGRMLEKMNRRGVEVQEAATAGGEQPLAGKTFVFTGSLGHFTRDEAEKRIEMLGGRTTSSVSSRTDFVVCGQNPGSKLDEARERNVEVLDEQEFEDLIGQ